MILFSHVIACVCKLKRVKQYSTPTTKEAKERLTRIAQKQGMHSTVLTVYLYEHLENNDVLMAELKALPEKTLNGDEIVTPDKKRYQVTLIKEAKERIKRIAKLSGKSEKVINEFIFEKCVEYDMMRLKWQTRMKKANKEREARERKELQKIEPLNDIIYAREKPRTRAPARNPVYSRKKRPIKLMLNTKPHYQTAIRYALDHSYDWTTFNVHEIRNYLIDKERELNPVNISVITSVEVYTRADILFREYIEPYNEVGIRMLTDKAKELYRILGIEWRKPKCSIWIERLLELWEVSHPKKGQKGLRDKRTAYLTTKQWYSRMGIAFPPSLESEANDVIMNRNELERSGLIAEIEYKIKASLKVDDEIENLYYVTDELTPFDVMHAKTLIRENPDHPYSDLLKDKIHGQYR